MLQLLNINMRALHPSRLEQIVEKLFKFDPLQKPIVIVVVALPNAADQAVQVGG